jgi:CRISPR-associated protein Cmr6
MTAIRQNLSFLKLGDQDSHPGLLLQRYLNKSATGEEGDPEQKVKIFKAAINAAKNPAVGNLYKIAFERWLKSLPKLTTAIDLQTVGRLIVGLGTENVVETGIRLHHTYGMPIIPGSALKGLAAHYCDQIWGERDSENPSENTFKFRAEREEDKKSNDKADPNKPFEFHQFLFGTTKKSGHIVFHDAWFIPDVEKEPLKLDVMTPHHPKWLNGEEPPTDFDSPIPVPFLSVAGKFHVAVSWHGQDSDQAQKWTDLSLALVADALKDWGVGGKTTSGYGRLDVPPAPPPPGPYTGNVSDIVKAVLLEEKTKKGGWRAQIKGFSQKGPIQNTSCVPPNANPGDVVELELAIYSTNEVAFKWPLPAKK